MYLSQGETSMTRHAEIAGAGLAGLVAALALLQRGWTIALHERAPALRTAGFSINIQENGLRVFEALGVNDEILARATPLGSRRVQDAGGRTAASMTPTHRVVRLPRDHLVEVLAARIRHLGGRLSTGSAASEAKPDGTLLLTDGEARPADLVVAADGVNSVLREKSGLRFRRYTLNEGATRLRVARAVPAFEGDDGRTGFELWSGRRRFMYRPDDSSHAYVTLSCPQSDRDGRAVPIDARAWSASFPRQSGLLERISRETDWPSVRWARFEIVRLSRWSTGRLAFVGDAAHAMPPNLGQGGGLAMVNALGLAAALEREPDIERGLADWERRERPLTSHTQFWSWLYSQPARLPGPLRDASLRLAGRSAWIAARLQRAATHSPTGWSR